MELITLAKKQLANDEIMSPMHFIKRVQTTKTNFEKVLGKKVLLLRWIKEWGTANLEGGGLF